MSNLNIELFEKFVYEIYNLLSKNTIVEYVPKFVVLKSLVYLIHWKFPLWSNANTTISVFPLNIPVFTALSALNVT